MKHRPEFDMTILAESAAQLHEIFLTFVEAGFTEHQALILIAELIKSKGNSNE